MLTGEAMYYVIFAQDIPGTLEKTSCCTWTTSCSFKTITSRRSFINSRSQSCHWRWKSWRSWLYRLDSDCSIRKPVCSKRLGGTRSLCWSWRLRWCDCEALQKSFLNKTNSTLKDGSKYPSFSYMESPMRALKHTTISLLILTALSGSALANQHAHKSKNETDATNNLAEEQAKLGTATACSMN